MCFTHRVLWIELDKSYTEVKDNINSMNVDTSLQTTLIHFKQHIDSLKVIDQSYTNTHTQCLVLKGDLIISLFAVSLVGKCGESRNTLNKQIRVVSMRDRRVLSSENSTCQVHFIYPVFLAK